MTEQTLQQRAPNETVIEQMARAAYCLDHPDGIGYDYDMRKYWEARMRAAFAVLQPRLKAAEGMREALEHAHKSRKALCHHSDAEDEGGDPDTWDSYCQLYKNALNAYDAATQPATKGEEG
jgi:hypothetical protein